MTFDEACELARVISQNRRFMVLAISRFELAKDLAVAYQSGTESRFPWLVAVMSVEDESYVGRLRDEAAWREFAACAPVSNAVGKSGKPAAVPGTVTAPVRGEQLSLFQ